MLYVTCVYSGMIRVIDVVSVTCRVYILPPISDWEEWYVMPLAVVCNNHSPAPIYGVYLPRSVLWCLLYNWCCQSLLHLSYVLAMRVYYYGAWSVPDAVYVLAICIVGCLVCICAKGEWPL